MTVVSEGEQAQRARGLGAAVTTVFVTAFLALPLIGLLAAPIVGGVMAFNAWTKSASRPIDMSLALGGVILYYAIFAAFALLGGGRTDQGMNMVLASGAFSLAWVWAFQARVGFGH